MTLHVLVGGAASKNSPSVGGTARRHPLRAIIRVTRGRGRLGDSHQNGWGLMELIQVDDIRLQIVELRKLIRVVEPGQHATLVQGSVRNVDFEVSADGKWVEANREKGLSFATSMKKFKGLLKLKGRHVSQVDVYAVDAATIHIDGLFFNPDRSGHVSLIVTTRMSVSDLVAKLERLALQMEPIGRISVLL